MAFFFFFFNPFPPQCIIIGGFVAHDHRNICQLSLLDHFTGEASYADKGSRLARVLGFPPCCFCGSVQFYQTKSTAALRLRRALRQQKQPARIAEQDVHTA